MRKGSEGGVEGTAPLPLDGVPRESEFRGEKKAWENNDNSLCLHIQTLSPLLLPLPCAVSGVAERSVDVGSAGRQFSLSGCA